MIKNLLLIGALLFNMTAHAVPGDVEDLGWIERSSVSDVLKQFGKEGLTCLNGKRIEDLKGYKIVANCSKQGKQFLVILWVSLDWSEGRLISIQEWN